MTIADVLAPDDSAARGDPVPVYVDDVWQAYRAVHDTVREWTSTLLHG